MRLIKKILCTLLVCLTLVGCSSTKHYVSYTIYPIGYLLNRIGGNKISTTTVQNNSMVQIASVVDGCKEILEDSMVLFHIGGLEPYMDLYEEDIKEIGVPIVDLSVLNAFLENPFLRSKYATSRVFSKAIIPFGFKISALKPSGIYKT